MLRAVVFDLDDTLYPELDYVKSGFRAVSGYLNGEFGIRDTFETMMSLFLIDKKDVFGRLLDLYSVEKKATVEKLTEIYRGHSPDTLKLFPDVLPCLEDLRKRGIKTGIITDGRVEGQRAKIHALGLDLLINEIVITDELGGTEYRKPCPHAFEIIQKRLDCEFSETAYVGDNPAKDFAVRDSLPVVTIEILRGDKIHTCGEYAKGILPEYKINDLAELKEITLYG